MILELLGGIGLTFIVTQSFLFKGVRDYFTNKWIKKALSCTQCFGFWAGIVAGLIGGIFSTQLLLIGFSTSILSYVLYLLIKPLVNKYD